MNHDNAPSAPANPHVATQGSRPETHARRSSRWASLRNNLEAILVAVILALIIRHFSLEAFEIPTGSMAPGLEGVHVDSTCPNCGTVSPASIRTDPESGAVIGEFRAGLVYRGTCPECGGLIQDEPGRRGARVRCAGCGYVDGVAEGYQELVHSSYWAWCPLCGLSYKRIFSPSDCLTGHKILVNKMAYSSSPPERWDVIVFRFNRQRNYIKRLAGLPGESVQIIRGDLWVNGEISRKPLHVQDHLWFPVHDSQLRERGMVKPAPWKISDEKLLRPREHAGFEFNALEGALEMRYQRAITNRYAYNASTYSFAGQAGAPPPHARRADDWYARDVRLQLEVEVRGGRGAVILEISNGEKAYLCSVPAGKGAGKEIEFRLVDRRMQRAAASAQGQPGDKRLRSEWTLGAFPCSPVSKDTPHHLDYFLADRRLVLRIDGVKIAELPFEETGVHSIQGLPEASVALRFERIGGVLQRIRVARDVHYTHGAGRLFTHATRRPFTVPVGGYFALGDNSPSSQDSRVWGHLAQENLLGHALWVFWPLLPGRFDVGFIR